MTFAALCRLYGITEQTGYKWQRCWREERSAESSEDRTWQQTPDEDLSDVSGLDLSDVSGCALTAALPNFTDHTLATTESGSPPERADSRHRPEFARDIDTATLGVATRRRFALAYQRSCSTRCVGARLDLIITCVHARAVAQRAARSRTSARDALLGTATATFFCFRSRTRTSGAARSGA